MRNKFLLSIPFAILFSALVFGAGGTLSGCGDGGFLCKITIFTEELSDAKVGEEYSFRIRTDCRVGDEWAVVRDELPPGIKLGVYSGRLYGTPTEAGAWTFMIKVISDSRHGGSDKREFALVVNP